MLNLSESLRDTHCTLYFAIFFNSPTLIAKLFDHGIYGISIVRSNRKLMPKLPDDRSMRQGDIHYQYSEKVICVKWKDNRGVVLVGSNIDGADNCSSVQRREKGMSSKTADTTKEWERLTFLINLHPLTVLTEGLRLGTNFAFSLIRGTWLQ